MLGVDLSEDMISKAHAARSNTDLTAGEVDFETVDAYNLDRYLEERSITGTFDRVFSNAAVGVQ